MIEPMDSAQVAGRIDHTVLNPDARRADVENACHFAIRRLCAGVCINPINVALARRLLEAP